MAWAHISTVSIVASDIDVLVGTVEVPATGGLEVRIKQLSPVDTSAFRAGLIYVVTDSGRTLGSRRFWGHLEGEDYQLGDVGTTSEETTGRLYVSPGAINRQALKAVNLSPWVLEVSARPWEPSGGGNATYNGGFVSTANTGLELMRVVFP